MLNALLFAYYRLLRILITALLAAMLIVVSMQVFSRFTGFIPRYLWTEEAARFCFVWVIMIGSIIAVRDRSHFNVDILPHPKTKRAEGIYGCLSHMSMLALSVVFIRYGYEFAKFGVMQTSEISQINMLSIYLAFPIAGASWTLFLIEHLARDFSLIFNDPRGIEP